MLPGPHNNTYNNSVVWEKFTIRCFHVKIAHGKTLSPLGDPTKNFNNKLFLRLKPYSLTLCIITQSCTAITCTTLVHRHRLWGISAYQVTV